MKVGIALRVFGFDAKSFRVLTVILLIEGVKVEVSGISRFGLHPITILRPISAAPKTSPCKIIYSLAQVEPRIKFPLVSIVVTTIILCLICLINISSSTAFYADILSYYC